MSGPSTCPQCSTVVTADDFLCEWCGLLLRPELASGEYIDNQPTIVRALMAPPQRGPGGALAPPPEARAVHDMATARFTVPLDAHTVPHLRAGGDIVLHPFEAYVASFIDGVQTVPELARDARLPEIEVQVVLKALLERRVIELHRSATPGPVPSTATEPMPLDEEPVPLGEEPPERPALAATRPAIAAPDAQKLASRPSPPVPATPSPAPRPPAAAAEASKHAPSSAPSAAEASRPSPQQPSARPLAQPASGAQKPEPRAATPPSARMQPVAPRPRTPSPPQAEDFLQTAVRLERAGQVDRAIEMLKRALERASAPAPLYNKLALILVNQRKDFSEAATLLERAVELEPQNAVYQQNLLKVVGLAAADSGSHRQGRPGLLARLTGKR
ncbi:tetratricopeptide repeat protein [Myxococcaceae bacterium GXIMD 01537]